MNFSSLRQEHDNHAAINQQWQQNAKSAPASPSVSTRAAYEPTHPARLTSWRIFTFAIFSNFNLKMDSTG
jgi:hypothetical protein